MRKNVILIAVVLTILASIIAIFNISRANANVYQLDINIDKKINEYMIDMREEVNKHPEVLSSSNPYDRVKNNEGFDKIVKLGVKALPVIEEKISNSKNSGSSEYILAIAGEKIAKVDLKGNDFGWSTGKQWPIKWNEYLKNVKVNTNDIINSDINVNDKIEKIVELGVMSTPYIINSIDKGKTELIPALKQLTKDTEYDAVINDLNTDNAKSWINNYSKFDDIRAIIKYAKNKLDNKWSHTT
jgi:hypothetical protein